MQWAIVVMSNTSLCQSLPQAANFYETPSKFAVDLTKHRNEFERRHSRLSMPHMG